MRPCWLGALLLGVVTAGESPANDLLADTWAATDGLGRELPDHEACGPPRPDKVVGIFYFLWLGNHSRGVYDLTRIVEANPADPPYGPVHAFHFWGEPHLGYYRSDDPAVIRRHAQMLTDAGVDVWFCDVTNAVTYDATVRVLAETLRAWQAETGRPAPKLAFLTHSHSGQVVQRLYDTWYAGGEFDELWFRWQGKPLILAKPDELSEPLRDYFTVRQSWAWSNPNGWFGDGRDKWPWLDHHPQRPGWHDDPARPEQIAVAVAQHATSNIGRSFHGGRQPSPAEQDPAAGWCFAEQLQRAIAVDPPVMFITGWNEWVAQRFTNGRAPHFLGQRISEGDTYFVDAYSQEYSRDIEPMRGGHGDAYYYQMVAGIRRFRGVRPTPTPSPPLTVDAAAGFGVWETVEPVYHDDRGDTAPRDHPGWPDGPHYRNDSGRNDFVAARVARDASRLYCQVRCQSPITAPTPGNWMVLLLNTDGDGTTGWVGCDVAVNRVRDAAGRPLVERCRQNAWDWEPIGVAELAVAGPDLMLTIDRQLVGLAGSPLVFEFKWLDNLPAEPDPTDLIDQGDTAPNGRFRYRFKEQG